MVFLIFVKVEGEARGEGRWGLGLKGMAELEC